MITLLQDRFHYVVVKKPPNLLVVPNSYSNDFSLLDILRKQIGFNVYPIHRLDKETTGCCIFSKTLEGHHFLINEFKQKRVHKKYLAVVEGSLENLKFDMICCLVRGIKRKIFYQKIEENGVLSLTEFRVLKKTNKFSLLECILHTGRMHQIRIHLGSMGYPIVGDKLYGSKFFFKRNHILLHASVLSFLDMEGKINNIKATVDPFFKYWVNVFFDLY